MNYTHIVGSYVWSLQHEPQDLLCLLLTFIIKQVTLFKSSLFLKIDFKKYTNIMTKLKWKLLTKVIKRPSTEAWVWIDGAGNTKGGSFTEPLTSCLTGLESAV